MAKSKLVYTLATEYHMDFEDILSFTTDSYIGIWNQGYDEFLLIERESSYFCAISIVGCDNLKELDDKVYEKCDEHINYVFNKSFYKLTLLEETD